MTKTKAILFDADGVVIDRDHYFSVQLAKDLDISPEEIEPFFHEEFQQCVVGKADLKEILPPFLKQWGWTKSADQLLDYWFKFESDLNQDLINIIPKLQSQDIFCCLGTNQEKYRSHFMDEKLGFAKIFDHCFYSAEMHAKKPYLKYWEYIWDSLTYLADIDDKSQVMFWDDTQGHVDGAKEFGFNAHLFTNTQTFTNHLEDAGLL